MAKELVKILIVGGGYAGVHAAKVLHKKFKKNQKVEISVLDKRFFHTLMTELHEIAGDRVPDSSVRISYRRIFSGMNVKVLHDEVTNIDFDENIVEGRVTEYPYDYLLIATGGRPAFFNIPGVEENALTLWSLDDAMAIRRHLDNTFRAASFEPNPEKRKSKLTIAVAGGGFTGVELVGELIEFVPVLCTRYEIDPAEVRLINVEALGSILQMLPPKPRSKAVSYMEKRGVEIMTNALITEAKPGSFTLKDGTVIEADTLVWTCGIKGNCVDSCSNLTEGKAGRKQVEATMMSPGLPNVFMAGDGIWFIDDGKPIPQIVEAAEQTAAVAAHNIANLATRDLDGSGEPELETLRTNFHGFMVSIGSKYAVSHTAGISLSGFPAMALKHVVNMYYQFGVAGVNAIWAYFKHEILDIRHGRSLIGGFAAWKTPNYWLVPLRMYLGVMWLIEGFKKIGQGWLNPALDVVSVPPAGADAGAAASEWVEGGAEAAEVVAEPAADAAAAATEWAEEGAEAAEVVAEPAADAAAAATEWVEEGAEAAEVVAEPAADAAAAATEWAEEGAEAAEVVAEPAADAAAAATEWVEEAVEITTQAAQTVVDATAAATQAAGAAGESAFGTPLLSEPWAPYLWFGRLIVNRAPFLFQSGIVIFEIAIGLAFLGGAFTFLSAAASIVFGVVLIVGAMTDASIFWYMLVAVAMMGGAGRSFGLDYWIMPFLKKQWNRTWLARRTYLYVGEPTKQKKRGNR